MSYGIDPTGFIKKTFEIIKAEIEASQRANINSGLNLLAHTVLGQINGIFSGKIAELWNVLQAVYASAWRSSASGAALDAVGEYTGTLRKKAEPSTVTLDQLFLDTAGSIPNGAIVSVGPLGNRFVLTESVSNTLGYPATFSAEAMSEETGPITGYAGTIDTIQSGGIGWNAKAAVTAITAETYSLDGKEIHIEIDEGEEQIIPFSSGNPWSADDVIATIASSATGIDGIKANNRPRLFSTTEGSGSAIQITGGTANAVLNFPTDLIKGMNSADAVLGRDVETDADYRLSQEASTRATGAGNIEAIKAALLNVEGVESVSVYENNTDIVDTLGLPAHAFEAIVQGGNDQDILDTIWEKKGNCGRSYGTTSGTVTDSMGTVQTLYFSRPVEIPVYISYTLSTDASDYPVDGDAQVKALVAAAGNALETGDDVVALKFKALPLGVTGVEDVTGFTIDTISPPTGTANIIIGYRSKAVFDTTNITVS